MALLGQDFIKFDEDTFQIRFTITDATVSLSNYRGWWGVALTPTGSTVIEKATTGWTSPSIVGSNDQMEMGFSSAIVKVNQGDFTPGLLLSGNTYYHELVLSATGDEDDSVVVASGEFTVNPSLFTGQGYRP